MDNYIIFRAIVTNIGDNYDKTDIQLTNNSSNITEHGLQVACSHTGLAVVNETEIAPF
jgi:hypothetical protein